jgi:biopolymer transport protein ExbD
MEPGTEATQEEGGTMKFRFSTVSISVWLLSLCLVTSIPAALSNASTWNELTIKLPYGGMWNFLAPLGFAYLGIVAIGLIVLWTAYRRRERWAWFVMLIALLFFYFPSYVLPVLLHIRRFGWPFLLDMLGGFRAGGYCWIVSLRPNYLGGIECAFVPILSGLLNFFAMLVVLLLPVKTFFWNPGPPQPGARTKIATLLKKHTWVWVLALLSVVAIAVVFVVRSLIVSSQNNLTEIQQVNRAIFAPYPMVQVDLAKAENAVPMPDAGQDDAIVIAVTRDGAVFLGQNKVDPAQLGVSIRDKLASKTDKTIYLRAGARTKYRDVEDVIDAIRSAGAEEVGLLTQRKEGTQLGDRVFTGNPLLKSVGLEVSFPSPPETRTRAWRNDERTVVVHVIYRPNAAPAYKLNAADVAHTELQSRLSAIFANRAYREMFVEGDDNLRFSDIADAIDIGQASKLDSIGLMTPGIKAAK